MKGYSITTTKTSSLMAHEYDRRIPIIIKIRFIINSKPPKSYNQYETVYHNINAEMFLK